MPGCRHTWNSIRIGHILTFICAFTNPRETGLTRGRGGGYKTSFKIKKKYKQTVQCTVHNMFTVEREKRRNLKYVLGLKIALPATTTRIEGIWRRHKIRRPMGQRRASNVSPDRTQSLPPRRCLRKTIAERIWASKHGNRNIYSTVHDEGTLDLYWQQLSCTICYMLKMLYVIVLKTK